MEQHIQFSIIVPVYNSRHTLVELCTRIKDAMQANDTTYEIILVNDHSKDDSWEVIRQIKKDLGSNVKAINLQRNFGQHKALLCGFQFAQGDYIVTIDDDLQYYPEDIALLKTKADETDADFVYGIYDERKHAFTRVWGSKLFAKIFQRYAHTPDKGSSFKLIKKEVIDKVKHYNHTYTFLDEVLSWHCSKIEFAEIRHSERKNGQSNYGFFKLLGMTFNLIVAYTTLPLRFMTWFGLISFLVCLGFIVYFVYQKITVGSSLGFTALIVSIFMSTGLILFSLGIIGEYLNRLFVIENKKPPFLIKEVLK